MYFLKRSWVFLAIASTSAFAAADQHAKVEVSIHKATHDVQFKVIPDGEFVINHDGPWSVTLAKPQGLTPGKSSASRADFKDSIPGFSLPISGDAAAAGQFDYKLVAFVCTKDKSKCFREVHQSTHTWK